MEGWGRGEMGEWRGGGVRNGGRRGGLEWGLFLVDGSRGCGKNL